MKSSGGIPELRLRFFWCSPLWSSGDKDPSSDCSGVEGASEPSEWKTEGVLGEPIVPSDIPDCLLLALVELDDCVESAAYSTTSHVCKVASGAKETRRLARDLRRASRREMSSAFFSSASRCLAASCCSSSVRRAIRFMDGIVGVVNGSSASLLFFAALGLCLRAGIGRKGDMVGLRMDFGAGAAACKNC